MYCKTENQRQFSQFYYNILQNMLQSKKMCDTICEEIKSYVRNAGDARLLATDGVKLSGTDD